MSTMSIASEAAAMIGERHARRYVVGPGAETLVFVIVIVIVLSTR
jgi:hypothetical protein